METSTLLMKNNRIRICNKNQLSNLVNHILRNYKPETRQSKEDFHPDETKHNVLIGENFKLKHKGADWFSEVEQISKQFKDNLEQTLIDADSEPVIISLSRSEKDKTIKSINYFSKLKNYDEDLESSILPIIKTCEDFKKQDSKNKDYSIFDKEKLSEAISFYENIPKEIKIKSLNAKKKNLTQILENVEAMKVVNEKKATSSNRSIGFEETLIKIPKHNEKAIKDIDMINIYKGWHDKHFKNFKVIGGAFHKDERTKKGNEVDDHLHIIKSGFNQNTKKFDLPDYTFKKGLEMAKAQGIEFEYDGANYNKAGDVLRLISGEALQTEFYKFANKKLEQYKYNFRFEKKELTDDEAKLRKILKEQSNVPKSQRLFNMATYYQEKAKESLDRLSLEETKTLKTKQERIENVKVANAAKNKGIELLGDNKTFQKKLDGTRNDYFKYKGKYDDLVFQMKNEKAETHEMYVQKQKADDEKLNGKTNVFKEYTKKFLDFILVCQADEPEHYLWKVEDRLEQKKSFEKKSEATEFIKETFPEDNKEEQEKRLIKPYLMKLRDKVKDLFVSVFGDDNQKDFDDNLKKINQIILNSRPDVGGTGGDDGGTELTIKAVKNKRGRGYR